MRDDGGRSRRSNMSDKKGDFLSEMVKDTPAETDIEPNDEPVKQEPEAEKGEPAPPAKETEATPAPDPQKEGSSVPLAALKAEREKRQAHEQRIKELERQLAAQPPTQPPTETPNFFESPETYVNEAVSRVQQQANERLYAVLDADAREAYPDYDEVMELVTAKVQENPALKQQIFSAANPAKAAYHLGQQFKELEAMRDPAAYRERVRAELRAEIEAELKGQIEAKRQTDSALPPDLAATRSNAGTAPPDGDAFATIFPT
jgi:hypothetical protein